MVKPGDLFGPYRVVKSLGKGGMGEVWLLQHEANGYLFAVKFLNPDAAADHDARKRFVREAQLAMSVRHENLVKVYDVGEDPDTGLCYILMEYVGGGTLRDRIRADGALPVDDALRVVRGVASVLEVTQAKQIVHRDIKPDNILFTLDGVPKLSDLGIARVRTDKVLTTVTVDGSVVGTPVYMAPEQMLDSHHVDVRADIYSLGIVFFEMLAGRRPWKDEGMVQMLARSVQHKEIIDVRNYRRSVPEEVADLVRRMCAAKLEQRIAGPRPVVNACCRLLGEEIGAALPGKRAVRASRRKLVTPRSARTIRTPSAQTWQEKESSNSAGGLVFLLIGVAIVLAGLVAVGIMRVVSMKPPQNRAVAVTAPVELPAAKPVTDVMSLPDVDVSTVDATPPPRQEQESASTVDATPPPRQEQEPASSVDATPPPRQEQSKDTLDIDSVVDLGDDDL